MKSVGRGLKKLGSVFHRNGKEKEFLIGSIDEEESQPHESPRINVKAINQKDVGVKYVVDDNLSGKSVDGESLDGEENSGKGHMKDVAKSFMKSAKQLKQVFSRKGSKKARDWNQEIVPESDSDSESSSDDVDDGEFTCVQNVGTETGTPREALLTRDGNIGRTGDDDDDHVDATLRDTKEAVSGDIADKSRDAEAKEEKLEEAGLETSDVGNTVNIKTEDDEKVESPKKNIQEEEEKEASSK
jgi:hypothetical protein